MHAASGQKEGAHRSIQRHCLGRKQCTPACSRHRHSRRFAIEIPALFGALLNTGEPGKNGGLGRHARKGG
jgi:hypothetical protein